MTLREWHDIPHSPGLQGKVYDPAHGVGRITHWEQHSIAGIAQVTVAYPQDFERLGTVVRSHKKVIYEPGDHFRLAQALDAESTYEQLRREDP